MNCGDIIPQMLKTVYIYKTYTIQYFSYTKGIQIKKGSRFDCPVAPATGIEPVTNP